MASPAYAIGIDFGTASARTLLLDLRSGEEIAVRELAYPHGVIDEVLPVTGERLPPDWALQDPQDYTEVLEKGISGVLADFPDAARHVVGIGTDTTSCTVMPVTSEGPPCVPSRNGATGATRGPSSGSTTPPNMWPPG